MAKLIALCFRCGKHLGCVTRNGEWLCHRCACARGAQGAFPTEAEALTAAREAAGYCAHGYADETPCEVCDGAA